MFWDSGKSGINGAASYWLWVCFDLPTVAVAIKPYRSERGERGGRPGDVARLLIHEIKEVLDYYANKSDLFATGSLLLGTHIF